MYYVCLQISSIPKFACYIRLLAVPCMQRPRSACQYVNQQEWDMDEDEFIMARRYNVLERFSEYETRGDQGMVREMRGEGGLVPNDRNVI